MFCSMESFDEIFWSSSKVREFIFINSNSLQQMFAYVFRISLTSTLSLDTRNDKLLPAHGVLMSASHTASSDLAGQLSHLVRIFQIIFGIWVEFSCKYQELHTSQYV